MKQSQRHPKADLPILFCSEDQEAFQLEEISKNINP